MAVIDLTEQWEAYPDASLVEEAQAGRLEAFTALYERHHGGIVRHCRARLGNDHDAADAAQETFLRAWRALGGFGGERRVAPWLRTIATNVCLDALRARNRAVPVATFDAAPAEVTADAPPDTEAVTVALARLSERHREILQLREYQGLSYERIAEQQQLDLNAVKSLLWRARQSLRREFLLVSAQGRLSALGALLLVRPAARLRALLSDASSAVAHAGVAGGTAASAMVVTATVALPAMGVAAPDVLPPRPAAVVAAAATPDAVVVHVPAAAASVASTDPGPALAAAAAAAPAPSVEVLAVEPGEHGGVAPPADEEAHAARDERADERDEAKAEEQATRDDAKASREAERAEAAEQRTDAKAAREVERVEAAEQRTDAKAVREAERGEAAEQRTDAKAERAAARAEDVASTGPPEHAGGPPADHPKGAAVEVELPAVVAPGQSGDRPDRGRGRSDDS